MILEAAGDDYSPAGHGRISAFTGRPAVIGWEGHEDQWGHDPRGRRRDVRRLYRARRATAAAPLLRRYGVRYVVVGPLERMDYGSAGIAKWDRLGVQVMARGRTAIWDLGSAPVARPQPPRSSSIPRPMHRATGIHTANLTGARPP